MTPKICKALKCVLISRINNLDIQLLSSLLSVTQHIDLENYHSLH